MGRFEMYLVRGRLSFLTVGLLMTVASTGTASAQAALIGHNGQLHGCIARSGVRHSDESS